LYIILWWQPNTVSGLLHRHPTFSKSAAVQKLGYINLIFTELSAKINKQHYQEVMLMQELLPLICSTAGDEFAFQQDNLPTHCAHDGNGVKLLCRETPHTNSPDLNPVYHHIRGMMQQRVYQVSI